MPRYPKDRVIYKDGIGRLYSERLYPPPLQPSRAVSPVNSNYGRVESSRILRHPVPTNPSTKLYSIGRATDYPQRSYRDSYDDDFYRRPVPSLRSSQSTEIYRDNSVGVPTLSDSAVQANIAIKKDSSVQADYVDVENTGPIEVRRRFLPPPALPPPVHMPVYPPPPPPSYFYPPDDYYPHLRAPSPRLMSRRYLPPLATYPPVAYEDELPMIPIENPHLPLLSAYNPYSSRVLATPAPLLYPRAATTFPLQPVVPLTQSIYEPPVIQHVEEYEVSIM